MNQNHANRGKAARILKAAAAVVQSLKQQGIQISQVQEAAAIDAATTKAHSKPSAIPSLGESE